MILMNESNKLKTLKANIKKAKVIDSYALTHGAFNGFNSTYNQVTVTEKDASDFARYFVCNPDAFNIMMDWLKDSKSKPKAKPKWWQWFGMV